MHSNSVLIIFGIFIGLLVADLAHGQSVISVTMGIDRKVEKVLSQSYPALSRNIQANNTITASLYWKKNHFRFGPSLGYGAGYLNPYPQSNFYDEPVNTFKYLILAVDGFYLPEIRWGRFQPFAKLSLGILTNYPYDVGYDYIKAEPKPIISLGVGVEYSVSNRLGLSYNLNVGHMQHDFSIRFFLKHLNNEGRPTGEQP